MLADNQKTQIWLLGKTTSDWDIPRFLFLCTPGPTQVRIHSLITLQYHYCFLHLHVTATAGCNRLLPALWRLSKVIPENGGNPKREQKQTSESTIITLDPQIPFRNTLINVHGEMFLMIWFIFLAYPVRLTSKQAGKVSFWQDCWLLTVSLTDSGIKLGITQWENTRSKSTRRGTAVRDVSTSRQAACHCPPPSLRINETSIQPSHRQIYRWSSEQRLKCPSSRAAVQAEARQSGYQPVTLFQDNEVACGSRTAGEMLIRRQTSEGRRGAGGSM